MGLRNELDLFVNVLHAKSQPGINSRHRNVDVFIVRQNTEGEYAMLEHEVSIRVFKIFLYMVHLKCIQERILAFLYSLQSVPGVVESMKVITRENSERVARYAFDFAVKNGRKKITTVHKANIMYVSFTIFIIQYSCNIWKLKCILLFLGNYLMVSSLKCLER